MKTHKTVFRYYTIMEYEKEQEWLSRQHRQGWKLTAAAACFYRFERCAPEDVVYQLDYSPEGRKHPEEYVQLSATAAGSTCWTTWDTAISANRPRRCRGARKSFATRRRAWRCSAASSAIACCRF